MSTRRLSRERSIDLHAPISDAWQSLFGATTAPTPTPTPAPRAASHDHASDDVVITHEADGRYLVALLRHGGSSRAAVYYSRAQLELLSRRVSAALGAR